MYTTTNNICLRYQFYTSVQSTYSDNGRSRIELARRWLVFMRIIFGMTSLSVRSIPPTVTTNVVKRWRIIFQPRWRSLRWKAKT